MDDRGETYVRDRESYNFNTNADNQISHLLSIANYSAAIITNTLFEPQWGKIIFHFERAFS
jgi:hypothetical protein